MDLFLFPAFTVLLCLVGLGFVSGARLLLNLPKSELPAFCLPLFGLFSIGFVSVLVNFITGVSSFLTYLALLSAIVAGLFSLNRERIAALGPIALLAVLLTPLTITMTPGYDAGLYHLPHQLWLRSEAIVLGLANMHGRFGFSSFQEYIQAPLWYGEQFKLLSYVGAAFFVSFLAFVHHAINCGQPLLRSMAALMSINLLICNHYLEWSYTYTDVGAGLVFALSFVLGLQLVARREETYQLDTGTLLFLFMMLSAVSVALKSSSIFIAIWVVFVVVQLLWQGRIRPSLLIRAASLPALFAIVWLTRGMLTTGCLLYPAAWTCLDVAWSAKTNAISDANWVTAWARHWATGLEALDGWNWLWDYWLGKHALFLFNLALAAAGVFLAIIMAGRYFQLRLAPLPRLVFAGAITVVALSLMLWFFKTPTPRFGTGVFIVAAPVVALFVLGVPTGGDQSFWRKISLVLIGLLILRNDGLERLVHFDTFTAPVPEVVADENFGVRPKTGDQCWLVEHCSPDPRPLPGKLSGYRIFLAQ